MSSHYQWTGKPKVGYARQRDAEIHRSELTKARGVYFQTYLCDCGFWHVGRVPKPVYDWKTEMLVGRLIGELRKAFEDTNGVKE